MFEVFSKAFGIKDLKRKLLFTFLIILIYRMGSAIPVPFIDASYIESAINQAGSFLGYLDVMSGGGLSTATIFALSITPYINSSIIIQLLTVAIPALERLKDEGEQGRKKLSQITRYLTIILALIQGTGYYLLLRAHYAVKYTKDFDGIFAAIIIVATLTAGTAFIVWLGERVSEKGIGNGISIILFAGMVSRAPSAIMSLWHMIEAAMEGKYEFYAYVPIIVVIFFAMVVLIVVMHLGERRIPIQYAQRVVGRKMYAGQSAHIPVKVSMSGVMPIIFASSILGMPSMISGFLQPEPGTFWYDFFSFFRYDSWSYAIIYFFLIIAFNFFYVTIQYNPIEIANNLRKSNGSIPGIRPGKATSEYISKVLWRISMVGAIGLAFIAVFPIVFSKLTLYISNVHLNLALGGTSIVIIVGVALETVRVIESQLTMQKHKGFLS